MARERDDLAVDLGDAIARDALGLCFQPFFDIGGALRGFEALSRWTHPTRGPVPCDVFIPLAESSGLIDRLGHRALERACAIAQTWSEPLAVAVNVSPTQILSAGFARRVADILARTGLSPRRLELEITENVFIGDAETATIRLRQVRRLGIRLALDDFGTGFSSLRYLARLPVDKVKIDQSFVRAMPDDPVCEAIVAAIVSLCRTLAVVTTAEGVETERHVEMLRRVGCDELQGYLLGPPLPAAALTVDERELSLA